MRQRYLLGKKEKTRTCERWFFFFFLTFKGGLGWTEKNIKDRSSKSNINKNISEFLPLLILILFAPGLATYTENAKTTVQHWKREKFKPKQNQVELF